MKIRKEEMNDNEYGGEGRSLIHRILPMLLTMGLLLSIPFLCGCEAGQSTPGGGTTAQGEEIEPKEEPINFRIVCAGDVMVHKPQIASQYDSATGTYDYRNNFQYVKPYIESADLALCNLETTFAGTPYTGYPNFSAPDELAHALKDAGFDMAITSNNHMIDKGVHGVRRTLEVARGAGLYTSGSRFEGEANYTLISAAGVSVGVVAYTYETPRSGDSRTINSMYITDEMEPLVNSFGYEALDEDLAEVKWSMDAARDAGAEMIICYFHWGNEYQREPNDYQKYIAAQAVSFGADIIFASHPHVLQGTEMIATEDGRNVPVFYSMGNFISNQRVETVSNNRYTEQGMLATVDVEMMKSTGEILNINMSAIPTWVDKYSSGGKQVYTIVPLDENFEQNEALIASGHLSRARQALEDCRLLLGDGLLGLATGQNESEQNESEIDAGAGEDAGTDADKDKL